MENAEMTKEWFVTHEGKQFGPVSIDDLKFEAERGQLNPRLDMVWRKDMDDWIPAGDLEGLFEKNKEAEAEEKKKEEPQTFGPPPEVSEKDMLRLQGKWPGSGRGAYFFMTFVLPFILGAGMGAAQSGLIGKIDPALLEKISFGVLLIMIVISTVVVLKRFQNLGMTRWWYFGLYLPPLCFWLYYRVFACPPGYAVHKKMDVIGWALAILYWLLFLASILAIAGLVYLVIQSPEEFKSMGTTEEMIDHLRKNYGLK